jgi:type II secretory pathway pseudopilin PulG
MIDLARARRQAASEDGFGLIEVVISAAVMVIVVLGILSALDSVSHTAGANQAKTVAATLAEKDLERLRGLRTSDLNDLATLEPATRTVQVGKVTYTIASKAQAVDDSTGQDISCALPTGKGEYLRITSTVTSPITGGAVRPVVMSSIVAPQPGQGTLTALVKNAAGAPVPGLPVQAVGPTPSTIKTNDAGCAVFGDMEAGSYTLRLNSSGWVDPDGNQLVEKDATVSAGNLTTLEFLYDKAASFTVKAVTVVGGVQRDDQATGMFVAHTGLASLYKKITATATSYRFTSLFPFTTPYKVYAGTCTGNDPVKVVPTFYEAMWPGAVVQLQPGLDAGTFTALQPAFSVTVTYNSGATLPNSPYANVYAYPKAAGCAGTRIALGVTNSAGTLQMTYPGMPFGPYDLCAEFFRSSSSRWYKTSTSVTNAATTAGTSWTAALQSASSTQAQCGATAP